MILFRNLSLKLFLFLFTLSTVYAEKIDGPANLRKQPSGSIVASINDKEDIEIEGKEGDWYKVRVVAYTNKTADSLHLKKGVKLFTNSGKEHGVVLNNVEVEPGPWTDEKRSHISFVAYTHKQNIRKETLLEDVLKSLIEDSNKNFSSDAWDNYLGSNAWDNYLGSNEFTNWINEGNFKSYIVHENEFYDVSPGPRIILFTYKNTLFAVLHKNKVALGEDVIKDIVARRYKVTILDNKNMEIVNKFRNLYYPVLRVAD